MKLETRERFSREGGYLPMKAAQPKCWQKKEPADCDLIVMKATAHIFSNPLHPFATGFLCGRSINESRTDSIALPIVWPTQYSASANADHQVGIGCVPAKAIYLLTAFLTTPQRQALHARNFCGLPMAARAVYLHCVAYAIGYTVVSNGRMPNAGMLSEHLTDLTETSVYDVPGVPPEHSQSLAEFVSLMETNMKELNRLIPPDLVNSSSYQQAMCSGTIHSYGLWQP
jgi:hypothetical protein